MRARDVIRMAHWGFNASKLNHFVHLGFYPDDMRQYVFCTSHFLKQ